MTKQLFEALIETEYAPVVLLEGRRKVNPKDEASLTHFARELALEFPSLLFRTGNADGSDTLFAKGIGAVDAARLQYVVPYSGMKKGNREPGAAVLSYDQIKDEELQYVDDFTAKHGNRIASMIEYGRNNPKSRLAAKAKYLLRDTLKVTGAVSAGFIPPVAAFFYIDPADKYAGGTGHTIRICEQLDVPVYTQEDWMPWYPTESDQ